MCYINVRGAVCSPGPAAQAQGANVFNKDIEKIMKMLIYWLLNMKVQSSPA